jgi:uncharacterized protein
MKQMEVRRTTAAPQLRAGTGNGSGNTLVGYAATFGTLYQLYPDVWETISPTAFTRTLKEKPDVRALYNHDTNAVLGRTKSGTLRLKEDSTGLGFVVDLPDTQVGRDVKELVRRKDVTGCSFGFVVIGESMTKRPDGSMLRTLLDVELHEISPAVTFPAYEDTSVSVRKSRGDLLKTASRPQRFASEKARIEYEHRERIKRLLGI